MLLCTWGNAAPLAATRVKRREADNVNMSSMDDFTENIFMTLDKHIFLSSESIIAQISGSFVQTHF